MSAPAIELQGLEVVYRVRGIDRPVLRGVDLTIGQGDSYGLVGESGCGKTTAAYALMRALPANGRIVGGSIRVNGMDLLAMSGSDVRRLRATEISMVY
jgi:peptide/nickel transport system ATP-binding protein